MSIFFIFTGYLDVKNRFENLNKLDFTGVDWSLTITELNVQEFYISIVQAVAVNIDIDITTYINIVVGEFIRFEEILCLYPI